MGKRLVLLIALVVVMMMAGIAQARSDVDLGVISLINGDVDGDNVVSNADLASLLSSLDGTNASCDLDGDGTVTTTDLSILLKNLGQTGDP